MWSSNIGHVVLVVRVAIEVMALSIRSSSPLRLTKIDLLKSCGEGDIPSVRRALCSGCDPNELRQGQTALMFAAERGHAEVCEMLLHNGAQVNAVDTYSRTALFLACKNLHEPVCRVLMAWGANKDIPCILGGETAADIVHMKGTIEMVRTVLYCGQVQPTTKSIDAPKETAPLPTPAASIVSTAEPEPVASMPPPVASNLPRTAPPAEDDHLRRTHTPPRRVG